MTSSFIHVFVSVVHSCACVVITMKILITDYAVVSVCFFLWYFFLYEEFRCKSL